MRIEDWYNSLERRYSLDRTGPNLRTLRSSEPLLEGTSDLDFPRVSEELSVREVAPDPEIN